VAALMAAYKLSSATADQYGAELTRSIYADAGISLQPSELNRSEAYLALQPLFTSGRIEIPADPRLRAELIGLERRTGNSGKDAVDHHKGQHDDLSNALAVACWLVARRQSTGKSACVIRRSRTLDGLDGLGADDPDPRRRLYDGRPQSILPEVY